VVPVCSLVFEERVALVPGGEEVDWHVEQGDDDEEPFQDAHDDVALAS
jgi:hypothetical protein